VGKQNQEHKGFAQEKEEEGQEIQVGLIGKNILKSLSF
jgi:hypothetical protein